MTNKSEKAFRIALTGAGGVGKTQLAPSLAGKLQLTLIPEVARQICLERDIKHLSDIQDQESFKREVLAKQISCEDETGSFVADRSTIDCWVLWERWNMSSAMTYDTEHYYEMARAQAQKYTHIIYIPPLFKPAEDGFRWTEPDYIKQIDRLIRLTFYDWNLLERVFTVTQADFEARTAEVCQWLSADR